MTKSVVLVTNVFPPAIGGPATFGARLAERLHRRGYRVKVVCATAGQGGERDGYPFGVARAGTRGNRLFREVHLRLSLLKAIAFSDFIYCMGLEHQTHWACRVTRRGFVLRIGGDSVWEAARNKGVAGCEPEEFYGPEHQAERTAVGVPERRRLAQLHAATAVIYVSDYLRRLALAWTDRRPVSEHVVLNGVDCDRPAELPRRHPGGPLRLLFVGRQTNWKGVDAVLLALARLDGVVLTVAGSGPSRPGNADLARRLGLTGRVEFAGDVASRDIVAIMSRHHVLVLPSLYEGLSNTLLEAGAAGLACIASDRAGNPEVVEDGRTGILVDPFDVESLAAAIAKLRDDEESRIGLAGAHRATVRERFDLSRTIDGTIDVLERAGR